jgi:hypothetical protein
MTTDDKVTVTALELIAAERARQQAVEGYTTEHDDEHGFTELARAAACYAVGETIYRQDRTSSAHVFFESLWPWDEPAADVQHAIGNKPRLRQLAIAGALIVAEIERLQRAAK